MNRIPNEVMEKGWEVVSGELENLKQRKNPEMLKAITGLIHELNIK